MSIPLSASHGLSGSRSTPPGGRVPRVSVVMPVHNASDTLAQAMQSILDQTLTDFELIVVDDGSTDDTKRVVSSFADARILYVRQENQGYPAAMNTGLAAATGTYVARMDGDDIAGAERLRQQTGFLEGHAAYGAVGTLYETLTPNGRRWQRTKPSSGEAWTEVTWDDIMKGHRAFADPSVMFRAEACRAAGGYRTYQRSGQDVDLWLRLIEHGFRFAVLQAVLYAQRISLGALTGRRLTGAYNKIPRLLAAERRERGDDRVMRSEPLEGLLTQEVLDRAAFWYVRDLWLKSRVCFEAGDLRAGFRFAAEAARRGGFNRTTVARFYDLLRSVRARNGHTPARGDDPGQGANGVQD